MFNNDPESMEILLNILSEIASKYSALGLQLLGSFDKVKQIETRVTDVQSYLTKMISGWLSTYKGEQPLSEILKAIRSKVIGNPRLANDLETKWKQEGCSKCSNYCSC